MSTEPFMGQIMLTAFNFAPKNWATCNGQLLPINQNQALFSLFGTTYGGDGRVNFALPDLRGRVPVSFASSANGGWQPYPTQLGERAGAENVTLNASQLPAHTHGVAASTTAANSRVPTGRTLATSTNTGTPIPLYAPAGGPAAAMTPAAMTNTGGNQPHANMQPYLALNFCVALIGIFPSQN